MKAIVIDKDGVSLKRPPKPRRKKGEALIRVTLAGVCATDIEITKGYMGFEGILGHEFTGVVTECTNKKLLNKRVVGEINLGCGKCALCKRGEQEHCKKRKVLGILGKDGVFCEYITLPEKNLHVIPPNVSNEEAVFTEPLAAAFEILQQRAIKKSERVLVMGDGKLALLCAFVLKLTGCELTVVGKHMDKLLKLKDIKVKTVLIDDLKSKEFDVVVEATGSSGGISTALTLVRPRGTVILKSTVRSNRVADLNKAVIDEITIIGSRCGPFKEALRALKEKKLDVTRLIEETYPLEEGVKAIKHAKIKGTLKVLIKND